MKAPESGQLENIGIAAVFKTVQLELGWIFRAQEPQDFGIDAHIEIRDDYQATGKLLATQIKSGPSWFGESTDEGFVYRGKQDHLEYWLSHSLPVILILYNPDIDQSIWQIVSEETITRTEKGWKVTVPRIQVLGMQSKPALRELCGETESLGSYSLMSFQDVSHAMAKRYSANIILDQDSSNSQVEKIVERATNELKQRSYHRNKQTKSRWRHQSAHVVWLFVYRTMDDYRNTNWICRTQWISPELPEESSPIRLRGKTLTCGVVIDWSEQHQSMRSFYKQNEVPKERYLEEVKRIVSRLVPLVDSVRDESLRLRFNDSLTRPYRRSMKKFATKIDRIYTACIDRGIAPAECKDLDVQFGSVLAHAHNMALPFLELGTLARSDANKLALVKGSLRHFDESLIRYRFELEKVNT